MTCHIDDGCYLTIITMVESTKFIKLKFEDATLFSICLATINSGRFQ